MYSRPTAPKSPDKVLADAFNLFGAALPLSWPFALVAGLSLVGPGMYMVLSMRPGTDPMQFAADPMLWVAFLGSYVIALGATAALYIATDAAAQSRTTSAVDVTNAAVACLPSYLLATVLLVLILIVGFTLLVLPGLALTGYLFLYGVFVVLRGEGPVASMGASFRLVRGNWWRAFAVMSVAVFLPAVIAVVVNLVISALALIVTRDQWTLLIVDQIASVAMQMLFAPWLAAATLAVYYDLGLRRQPEVEQESGIRG